MSKFWKHPRALDLWRSAIVEITVLLEIDRIIDKIEKLLSTPRKFFALKIDIKVYNPQLRNGGSKIIS